MGSLGPNSPISSSLPQSPLKNVMHGTNAFLKPTWEGYVSDTQDALLLFQAAIDDIIYKVVRRPHDRERSDVIKSGSIFIYEETSSGIKRWTDGVPWSPSRILGNFLIYRELEKPFPPGEKKRATKKQKPARPGDPYPQRQTDGVYDSYGVDGSPSSADPNSPISVSQSQTASPLKQGTPSSAVDKESERSLVGSLTDSYQFKEGGLVKKTMSITHEGGSLHLVSYYNPDDVKAGRLPTPQVAAIFKEIRVRPELIQRQNFRSPLEHSMEDNTQMPPQSPYPSTLPNQYLPAPQHFMAQQGYQIPQQPIPHSQGQFYPTMPMQEPNPYQQGSHYPHPSYQDFNRSPQMDPNAPGPFHSMPGNQQMPMPHPDHSSYLSQSPFDPHDRRQFQTDQYGTQQQMKPGWSGSHES